MSTAIFLGGEPMSRLNFAVMAIVAILVSFTQPVQAQNFTETVRDAVIASVKEKTGRTLVINGELSFSMQPSPQMSATQVILSNPEGFDDTAFITMDQIDITFDFGSALIGNFNINGFVMEKPVINLLVDKSGANNWTFGAKALQAGVFEISNGVVKYSNAQNATEYEFADVNLKISAASQSDPLEITGAVKWQGEKMTLASSFTTLELLNKGKDAKIDIKLVSKQFSADFTGNLLQQKSSLKLTKAKLQADGMTAIGNVTYKYGKKRPYIFANFKLDRLNLTRYLGIGSRKAAGWSKQKIDFSRLMSLDGEFNLSADVVQYEKIKTGAAILTAKLKRGVLKVNMPRLALYSGTAKLKLSVDGRKPRAAVAFSGNIRNVKALPFLLDAADIRKISGRANIDFNLAAGGRSQYAFMQTLRGSADFNFRKGALLGVNIGRILRSIKKGKTSGFARGGKTPFGKFRAKFRFRKGVGTNKNLRMSGGEVLITGGGKVRMPPRTLSFRVNPSLVGKGGISVLGINVPIIITGPWANPQVYPDLPGFLDAPEIALRGLAAVGKGGIKGVVGVVETVTSPIGKILQAPFKKLF